MKKQRMNRRGVKLLAVILSIAAVSATADVTISARVLSTGGGAAKARGTSLRAAEKEMASVLDVDSCAVVASGRKSVGVNGSFSLTYAHGRQGRITPIAEQNGRVTVKIAWELPSGKKWKKTLAFKRGMESMVGGPAASGGGKYLLSLRIQ